jgi:hypothetical protein
MLSSNLIRWGGLAATAGGTLWVPYGVFEMLEPWGAVTTYREDVGYELITDAPLYVAYHLPGWTVALLCLGLAGLSLFPLWPLVYALQWVSQAVGAALMILFGLGWTVLGYMLWSHKGEELCQHSRVS